MTSLEPGQLWVMRIHGFAGAIVLLAVALAGEVALASADVAPFGLLLAAAVLLGLYPGLISPGKHYRAWGYRVEAEELHVSHGVWTMVRTVVPFSRVQHIDVAQGPIERHFRVSRLVLHTAGTAHSEVVLPGLTRATAEALRDQIRAQIRRES